MSYTTYCIVGTLVFYLCSSALAYGFTYIGDYNTDSKFVESWYYRGVYDTEYISFGKLAYYWIMNLVGFVFVNIVNLRNERKCPILD
jgi:hypothetical protein